MGVITSFEQLARTVATAQEMPKAVGREARPGLLVPGTVQETLGSGVGQVAGYFILGPGDKGLWEK